MRNKKFSLTNEEAIFLGRKLTQGRRYRLNEYEESRIKEYRGGETVTETNQYEVTSTMSALRTDGSLMDIDEYCDHYGLDRSEVRSYKLVTHTGTPFYNIASGNVEDSDEITYETIRDLIKKDLDGLVYKPKNKRNGGKIIVVSMADLHMGAYVDSLVKTKPFSISILVDLLEESASIINEYNAKEVNIRLLGDLIESFTGLNHKNSWKGLQKGMIGAEVVKLTTTILHKNFLSKINNLGSVGIISGNHDRVTSNKDEDTDGDAANLIAWGLDLIGYNVKFNPFILSDVIDGINYIDLHGHDYISRKSTKDICWDYGKQGVFNFIREGHLHSTIERLSASQRSKFQTIKDDAIDHRRMNIPSFFTGNGYSERLGYTSNSGFIVSYNNGKGIPNVDFKAL